MKKDCFVASLLAPTGMFSTIVVASPKGAKQSFYFEMEK